MRANNPKRKRRPEPVQPCSFCTNRIANVGYKDVDLLLKFVTPYGKMFGRKKTGSCSRHQKEFTEAVKRARYLALIPYVGTTLKD